MKLIVCETPAQLFNAVNIRVSLLAKEEVDIIFCVKDTRSDDVRTRVKDSNIFTNTYSFVANRDTDQSMKGMLRKAVKHLSLLNNLDNILPNKDIQYDSIYIAGPDMCCVGLYYYFKKKNRAITLNLYEEGIFEYYIFSARTNKQRRFYSKTVFGSYYLDECKNLLVYNKNLVVDLPAKVNVINIPNVRENQKLRKHINFIFDYQENEDLVALSTCKIMFLETIFAKKEDEKQQLEILKRLKEKYGQSLVVKLHPDSKKDKYDNLGITCVKSNYTMELIELNLQKEDFVLMSLFSSAIFNFWLVLGYAPKCILLYKLFKDFSLGKSLERYLTEFAKCYPVGKISIPESIDKI